jgi:hypothetical protein
MNKRIIHLIILIIILCVVTVIGLFFLKPVATNFNYYQSGKFSTTAWRIQFQFYDMFFTSYYRNPLDGNEFLSFCDSMYFEHFNTRLDNALLDDGIEIIEIADSVLIISLGYDKVRNPKHIQCYADKIGFFDYLIKQPDIIIGKLLRNSLCDFSPKDTKIFRNGVPLNRDHYSEAIHKLKQQSYLFSTKVFGNIPAPRKGDTTSLFLKGVYCDSSLDITVVCDPYSENNYNYSPILDSLSEFLKSKVPLIDIADQFYFPLSIDTLYFGSANQFYNE